MKNLTKILLPLILSCAATVSVEAKTLYGDIDGDGESDKVVLDNKNKDLYSYRSGNKFEKRLLASKVIDFALGDINGDGFCDIGYTKNIISSRGNFWSAIGSKDGFHDFLHESQSAVVYERISFNNETKKFDVETGRNLTKQEQLKDALEHPSGKFLKLTDWAEGDIDGDKKPDYVAIIGFDNELVSWRSRDNYEMRELPASNLMSVALGDTNGDGFDDLGYTSFNQFNTDIRGNFFSAQGSPNGLHDYIHEHHNGALFGKVSFNNETKKFDLGSYREYFDSRRKNR